MNGCLLGLVLQKVMEECLNPSAPTCEIPTIMEHLHELTNNPTVLASNGISTMQGVHYDKLGGYSIDHETILVNARFMHTTISVEAQKNLQLLSRLIHERLHQNPSDRDEADDLTDEIITEIFGSPSDAEAVDYYAEECREFA